MLIGLTEIINQWTRLSDPNVYSNLISKIGVIVKMSILQKTAMGYDYLGHRFSPYTEAYKAFKQRQGLSGNVDLSLTGQMLNSLIVTETNKSMTCSFSNAWATKKAGYNEEGRKPRQFMGVSSATEKQIEDLIISYIDKVIGI